ncbi:N-acetyltransferase family protein [Lutimonas halocynthiae]|uniref:GNAT family N-acetyltransferase n=1 Tax=Lutimonas halocynthiae TaxID=1446477 RepID=UPI0025B481BC|nr:GNAT family N-acetyltransferase [Lutimonas halocynthiae]MDN3641178.1 N-acetyltransferase family protein [Lutimonas halocynthiae]
MKKADWPAVSGIYRQGIETGMATFEQEVPEWDYWNQHHVDSCRLVAREGEKVLGWAALSAVSSRCVYGGVVEVSVYIAEEARGNRIGERLLSRLIDESEAQGYWTLQSGIFPENVASISLHEKLGFRKIGFRERIGQLHGVWKDNILMEKRSKETG